ncbi:MAG: PilZ domain-containing protein [Syntrophobacterales bacterium]|nr:MAG: PilZ domain-containing protein [Syntrophobacterales bacterium]
MKASKAEERREHPRVKLRIEVGYQKIDSYLHRFTDNISEGGCFVETDELLPPRTEIPLEFSFPNHAKPIVIIGEVVWVVEGTHSGMGIQYKKISPAARKVLKEIVQSRMKGEKNA